LNEIENLISRNVWIAVRKIKFCSMKPEISLKGKVLLSCFENNPWLEFNETKQKFIKHHLWLSM